jgi:hypothetical protein
MEGSQDQSFPWLPSEATETRVVVPGESGSLSEWGSELADGGAAVVGARGTRVRINNATIVKLNTFARVNIFLWFIASSFGIAIRPGNTLQIVRTI